ncbi:MAG: hypothetical protein HQK60_03950 [Deltaproteobacteria bacterium]|nr:hypothetical protein [Deltaproteobacteria bacterium]
MRYFKPIRIDMYAAASSRIKQLAPEVPVYLCMESEEVWRKALGFYPGGTEGVSAMLNARVFQP